VIVDDASTDQTAAVARELASRARDVSVIEVERSRGPGPARQAGLDRASGEFVQFLDSDDVLDERKLERQVAELRRDDRVGVVYGETRWTDAAGVELAAPGPCGRLEVERLFPALLRERLWDTQAPLFRREVLRAAGPWAALRAEEDWEYDARVGATGVRVRRVPGVVATTRRHARGHLSRGGGTRRGLAHRARARLSIAAHARRAGVDPGSEEASHFARAAFLLARQCAAAGLPAEAQALCGLARSLREDRDLDLRVADRLARTLGWRLVGVLSATFDRSRPTPPACATP
jgi:cellulose synthase/poly-beta-1,6-N-acetylglucosamine synthase-like glycosyltransferase